MNKKLSCFLLAMSFIPASLLAYNAADRYTIMDDNFKTEEMLRPYGHDFLFDLALGANSNVTNLINDIKGAKTTTQAQTVLHKYDKTEQTLKLKLAIGIPIFSFSLGQLKIMPNFRVLVDYGMNLGIRTMAMTPELLLSYFNISLPAALKTAILNASYAQGDDLLKSSVCTSLSADPVAQAVCIANQGKYFYPDPTAPNLQLFAKLDGKVGFFNDYKFDEHIFGSMNLYGLARTDIYQLMSADMLAKGQKPEIPKSANTEGTVQVDYKIGYKNANYSAFLSLEELKLATVKKKKADAKDLTYGYNPLFRVHSDMHFTTGIVAIDPFVGLHSRSGYSFSEGLYTGATASSYVWGDRLGLSLTGMFDKQYLTLTPRIKLWFMQLEYSLRKPLKASEGDVNLSTFHSVDFRLFF